MKRFLRLEQKLYTYGEYNTGEKRSQYVCFNWDDFLQEKVEKLVKIIYMKGTK